MVPLNILLLLVLIALKEVTRHFRGLDGLQQQNRLIVSSALCYYPKKPFQFAGLIDSDSEQNFIHPHIIERSRIMVFELDPPIHVSALDGRLMASITRQTPVCHYSSGKPLQKH